MLVSAIITTYNRCNLLKNAINSVLNQTYHDIEIIVVDDHSTDETESYMSQLDNPKIRYYHLDDNLGVSHARNFGIQKSLGDYIAFLDDDDEWMEDKIEKQMPVFDQDERIGLVYTQRLIINDRGKSYKTHKKGVGDLSHQILLDNMIGPPSSVIVKKDVFSKAGYFDEDIKIYEDFDLWIRIAQHYHVGNIDEALVKYHDAESIERISIDPQKINQATGTTRRKYKHLYEKLTEQEKKLHRSQMYFGRGNLNLNRGHRFKAAKCYILSLSLKPRLRTMFYLTTVLVPKKHINKYKYFIADLMKG